MDMAYRAIGGAFALADGQNLSILALFNKANSPFLLLVDRIFTFTASLTAVTGVGVEMDLRRITALTESGGAVGVLAPMATQYAAMHPEIAEYVRPYAGGTTTGAGVFAYRTVSNEEIGSTASLGWAGAEGSPLWEATVGPGCDRALQCTAGQGAEVFQVTNSVAGAWIVGFDFRLRRQKGG